MKFSKRRDSATARNKKAYIRYTKEVDKKDDKITKDEDVKEREDEEQDGALDY
jgi:hypothetical protein